MCSSSYLITTWYIRRLCSCSRSFTSCSLIYDPTDIRWVAVKHGQMFTEIRGFSIATQRILVGSQIWKREVKERLNLHNLRIDHVIIQSELKYLMGAKYLGLQRLGFEVETSPNAMVRVFHVVKQFQQFSSGSNPNPELFWRVGTVADTSQRCQACSRGS